MQAAPQPQQQQLPQLQPHPSLPSTRGAEVATTSSGGAGGNISGKSHHQTHAARISEAVSRDLAALANPDVSSPFKSTDDAVDRLLPYHLLAQEGPEAADADEVETSAEAAAAATTSGRIGGSGGASSDSSGPKSRTFLLLSRRHAWLEVASRRASRACDDAGRTADLAEEAIRRAERASEVRKEELWLVARWEREEAEAGLRRARREAAASSAAAAAEGAAASATVAASAPSAAPSNPPPPPPPPGYYI